MTLKTTVVGYERSEKKKETKGGKNNIWNKNEALLYEEKHHHTF